MVVITTSIAQARINILSGAQASVNISSFSSVGLAFAPNHIINFKKRNAGGNAYTAKRVTATVKAIKCFMPDMKLRRFLQMG